MSARFEVVHTGPRQFHARFIGGNGEPIWVTESYTRRAAAHAAIWELAKPLPVASTPWEKAVLVYTHGAVEVREVDEREVTP